MVNKFSIANLEMIEPEEREGRAQRKHRIAEERKAINEARIGESIQKWNPFSDEKVSSDPDKTLLVARINKKMTAESLKFEFEKYGLVKNAWIIKNAEGESRGYGFVEFQHTSDFLVAFKEANCRKHDSRKQIVDYERGRTCLLFRPRRLGGGKGGETRMLKEELERLDQEGKLKKEKRKEKKELERERERSRRKEKKDKKDKKEKKEKKDKDRHKEKSRHKEKGKERERHRAKSVEKPKEEPKPEQKPEEKPEQKPEQKLEPQE